MKICINIFITLVFFNFNVNGKYLGITSDSAFRYLDTTFSLGYGFTLHASNREFYPFKDTPADNFTTYTSIKIINDKKIVFSDTSLREYEFDHDLKPLCRELKGNKYEFLLGINDRPNANYFLHLIVKDSKIIAQDKIPASIMDSKKIIGKDGFVELSGYPDYREVWGDSANTITDYDPLLFYKFKDDGIVLDTAKTIKVNTDIYGRFEGYKLKETPHNIEKYFNTLKED